MKEKQEDNTLTDVDYSLKIFKNFFIYSLLFSGFTYGIYFSLKTIYPTNIIMSNAEIPCFNDNYKFHYKFPFTLEINPLEIQTCLPLSQSLPLEPFFISFAKPKMEAKIPVTINFTLFKKIVSLSLYLGLNSQNIQLHESELDLNLLTDYVKIPLIINGVMKMALSLGLQKKEVENFSLKISSENFKIEEQVYVHEQFGNLEIPLLDFQQLQVDLSFENKILSFKKFVLGKETPLLELTGSIKINFQNIQASEVNMSFSLKADKGLKDKLSFLSLVAPSAENAEGFSFKIKGTFSQLQFE